jgi:hypothetical protein
MNIIKKKLSVCHEFENLKIKIEECAISKDFYVLMIEFPLCLKKLAFLMIAASEGHEPLLRNTMNNPVLWLSHAANTLRNLDHGNEREMENIIFHAKRAGAYAINNFIGACTSYKIRHILREPAVGDLIK